MATTTQPETTTVPLPGPAFPTYDRQVRFIDLAASAANAPEHDRHNTFPHDTSGELVDAGYHTLTIPEALGGMGAGALEIIALNRAMYCFAT